MSLLLMAHNGRWYVLPARLPPGGRVCVGGACGAMLCPGGVKQIPIAPDSYRVGM